MQNSLMKALEIRKSENLTIRQMAEKLGVSPSCLCQVETGKRQAGRGLFKSYLKAFPDKVTYQGFFFD